MVCGRRCSCITSLGSPFGVHPLHRQRPLKRFSPELLCTMMPSNNHVLTLLLSDVVNKRLHLSGRLHPLVNGECSRSTFSDSPLRRQCKKGSKIKTECLQKWPGLDRFHYLLPRTQDLLALLLSSLPNTQLVSIIQLLKGFG